MQRETQLSVFKKYLSIACQYCVSCESTFAGNQREFLSHLQGLLLELYSLGRLLPANDFSAPGSDSLFKMEDAAVYSMITYKVPFSYYWQVLDLFSTDQPEVGVGDLLDDLGDIYVGLKGAVLLYDSKQGHSTQQAYWKLKFDFDFHLADHLMDAIKAIHEYMNKDGYNCW